jgi:uncharacterized alkaline shock family protein YloU
MVEQRTQDQQDSLLQTERGLTRVEDSVVQKIAGLALQEIEGIQMGGGTARAVSGLLESVSGGGGETRGVSVEVGEEETAIDLAMAVEYGRPIPRISEEVRRNVVRRVEDLVGLRVAEVNITVNDVLVPEERAQAERQRELEADAQE